MRNIHRKSSLEGLLEVAFKEYAGSKSRQIKKALIKKLMQGQVL